MTEAGPYGYLGGWTTDTGPYDCPNDSYVNAENMELVGGRLQKMSGNTRYSNDTFPVASPFAFEGVAIFHGFLFGASGGSIARSPMPGNWTDITGGAATVPSTNVWTAVVNDILIFGSQDGLLYQQTPYSAAAIALVTGTPPKLARTGTMVSNYLFVGNYTENGGTSRPNRIEWSAVLDPNTWPAANFVDVRVNDDPISVIFPFGEDLLIFKGNSVSRFYTNQIQGSLGPLVTVTEKFGCPSSRGVDRLPDGRIVFLGTDNHIYLYDGNTFTDISDQPYPRSNIQSTLNTVGFTEGDSIVYYRAKNQIRATVIGHTWTSPAGKTSSAGTTFIYDLTNNVWTSAYTNHKITKSINYDLIFPPILLSGGREYIYQEDNGNNNTDKNFTFPPFDGFVTKTIGIGQNGRSYIPRSAFVPINSASFSGAFIYGANGYNTPTKTTLFSFLGSSATEYRKFFTFTTRTGNWNSLQVKIEGSFTNQPFILTPFSISDQIEPQR